MLRESYTAIVERSEALRGSFATEPYECGWAGEAIFFVRILERVGNLEGITLHVQISPDGIRWCDEGTAITLGEEEVAFGKVAHFGNWLRLSGRLPDGASMRAIIALSLKA
ncbi:MAG: hypothetical protein OXI80_09995 [Caldilineaceae bacterium]|nr:hypothetical protein [Caldilineaceae bacterium]MDE0337989.1 hypothetical protein [Caldilineaceae bacterium]